MSSTLLHLALNPRSIAVIGASDNRNKIGGRPIHFLKQFGYRGKVFPVNPQRAEVQGLRCYPTLAAIGAIPELAVIVVPGQDALASVRECAQLGVKVAVVIASGFGETGAEGLEIERQMVAAARAGDMRLIGPNTQGLANFGSGAITSFSTMFIEMPPEDGPVAIVSQSGAASVVAYGLLREQGIGVRYVIASGNDAEVSVTELLEAVAHDPEIKLILLYAETIKNARALADAARIAGQRGTPIVALKSGRSAGGVAAAQSHTGAIANEDRVVDAYLVKHGIWRAPDMRGLVNAAELYLKGWRPKGNKLAVLSNSGAACVLAADLAASLGVPMARLSDATRTRLSAVLPNFATKTNPIDVTAALLTDSGLFGAVLPILAQDDQVDMVLIAVPVAGAGYDLERFARDTTAFVTEAKIPTVVAAPQAQVRAPFRARGIPTFAYESDALCALHQFASHALARTNDAAQPTPVARSSVPAGSKRFLTEAQSLALLAQVEIPVIAHRVCATEAEALEAFANLGAPVAVKACSPDLPHKSEHGLVHLYCAQDTTVRSAFRACLEGMQRLGAENGGVVVAKMARGEREFALGGKIDPVFGPVLMLSDGGKWIEVLPDNTLLLPPVTREQVLRALRALRVGALFDGVRGSRAWDVERLADIAVKLGDFLIAARDQIVSIDVNPVIVGAAGAGAVVVDALVERKQG